LLSILISEPDHILAKEIKSFFETKSYIAHQATNGKDCQLKTYNNKYLAVILDMDTSYHSGLEVLRYLRLNAPSIKVILTLKNKKRLESLELDKKDLRKLGASDIIIKPYSMEMLLASIEGAYQFESWKKIKSSDSQQNEEEINTDDEDFTRLKIQDFYSGNTTIFDHYIRLSQNKYIKILHKGDVFEKSRIEKYEFEKKVEYLYFKTTDRAIYINFINQVLEKMIKSIDKNTSEKVKITKNLTEKYIEEVYTVGLKPQLIHEGKQICENMYNLIQKNTDLSKIMAEYEEKSPSSFSHLFLVSFFAGISCKNLEWSSKRTVELIVFGSLLHDIGKLKLPESISRIKFDQLDKNQLEIYKEHPKIGAEMLQTYPIIKEPIRQIVYQHHEYVNGEGFPNGLTGMKIYPLAKVVSFADELATILVKDKITPLEGLREIIPDRERITKFDPLVVKAMVKGFIPEK